MKTIYLAAGTEHVQFDELAPLIAIALHPLDDSATDNEMMAYGCTLINLEAELLQATKSGELPVKDPLTFGPHSYPVGHALKTALVSVNDLRVFLADRPITIESAPATDTATPAPVVAASDGHAKPRSNKSQKSLIFEATVLELMGKFWNERRPGTEPTKGDLHKLVYDEILRTPVRGARKTTLSMVYSAAKPWKFPLELPAFVPDSKFNDKRHPFKGAK